MRAVGAGEQGVAVRGCLRHIGRGDAAIGADPVVDHDALVERDAERLADDPRDDVGAAARPERHDDGDRPARVGLRLRSHRERRRRERRRAAQQGDDL